MYVLNKFGYTDEENEFGKMSLAAKAMKLRYKEGISLKEAWDKVLKKTKKSGESKKLKLEKLSLTKLRKMAKKHKISIYRKGSKKMVKKPTLIKRLLKIKKLKKVKFGEKCGQPVLNSWSDLSTGMNQAQRNKHYEKIPKQFISYVRQPNIKLTEASMKPSMAPYYIQRTGFGYYNNLPKKNNYIEFLNSINNDKKKINKALAKDILKIPVFGMITHNLLSSKYNRAIDYIQENELNKLKFNKLKNIVDKAYDFLYPLRIDRDKDKKENFGQYFRY